MLGFYKLMFFVQFVLCPAIRLLNLGDFLFKLFIKPGFMKDLFWVLFRA